MQENFTMIKMTHPYDEDVTCSMQNVVLEENKEFKYTLFSLYPL